MYWMCNFRIMGYTFAMKNTQQKQLLLAGGFVALMVAVTVGLALISKGNTVGGFISSQTSAITSSDHIRGATSSSVSIIEYGDFQCPACGTYEPIVQQLEKKYGDKVTFVFRHFPLYQIHPNALISAQATEAASLQGKFWEMHDILYSTQKEWSELTTPDATKKIHQYAVGLGLDSDQFDTDITAPTTIAKVQLQLKSGEAAKIDHTPTFFLNLTQIQNPNSYDEFAKVIDAALASQK